MIEVHAVLCPKLLRCFGKEISIVVNHAHFHSMSRVVYNGYRLTLN